MFIMSFKFNKIKKIFLFLLFSFLIGFIIIFNHNKNLNMHTQENLTHPISLNGKTNESRIKFFTNYGWKLSGEPCEVYDVFIPQNFDDVFKNYNDIQKNQKMNLEKYKGKKVKHYSYEILNYPNHNENIRGNLLVYNGQIIACDICSLELHGFMHEVFKKWI